MPRPLRLLLYALWAALFLLSLLLLLRSEPRIFILALAFVLASLLLATSLIRGRRTR
jgi:hypothetical protein